MKFIVNRESKWYLNDEDKDIGIDEAMRESIVGIETRTYYTPEEFDAKHAHREGEWLSVGTNHRVDENGWITRDKMIDVWSVEINTLDELIKFCDKYTDKYGVVTIRNCVLNKTYKEIFIWDITDDCH